MEEQSEKISFLKQFKPGDIPADASYVTEEELERLPDYVLDLIIGVENGEIPQTTKEELHNSIVKYFESPISTSTPTVIEEVVDTTTSEPITTPQENDITSGDHSDTCGKVHSSKQ